MLGYADPGTTIIPPVSVEGARWEPEGDEVIAWDLEGANALLEERGYVDTDGDGVREMPRRLARSRPPARVPVLRADERADVASTPPSSSPSGSTRDRDRDRTSRRSASGRARRHHQRGHVRDVQLGLDPRPGPGLGALWFTCDQRPPDGSTYGNNDSYYCNPEYDRLYQEQRQRARSREALGDRARDAADLLQRRRVRGDVVRPGTSRRGAGDRLGGLRPQPQPEGDPLEGWGGAERGLVDAPARRCRAVALGAAATRAASRRRSG